MAALVFASARESDVEEADAEKAGDIVVKLRAPVWARTPSNADWPPSCSRTWGYSAPSQRDEVLAIELLEEHRALLRPFFPRFNGHRNQDHR